MKVLLFNSISSTVSLLSRPLTRSEWVKTLQTEKLLTLDCDFFSTFDESTPTSNKHLLRLIKGVKVAGFDFNVTATEEPKTGKRSREHFGKVIRKVIDNLTDYGRSHDCDGRNSASIGTHQPDYLERSDVASGEQGIVCVGEIKGILDANREFSDEEVGQILDFLQELLNRQGWRKWIYGFLTDGVRFEFFRCMRRGDAAAADGGGEDDGPQEISFTKSGLLSKGEGWLRLSQLLQQSNQQLGFTTITLPGWSLDTWLGSGATTSVFKAVASEGRDTAVCKIFLGKSASAVATRDNEARALRLMSADLHTPKIRCEEVRVSGGEQSLPVLLVTPVGEPLGFLGVRLPIRAYAVLVDTLRRSHGLGLCHIDVCGDNMFAVPKNPGEDGGGGTVEYDVILNDWASSMLTKDVKKAKRFSTHKLYYDVNRMGPTEDVAALVRSVFVLTQQCIFAPVETAQELDETIRRQWSWGDALDCARQGRYDAVSHFFRTGTVDMTANEKEEEKSIPKDAGASAPDRSAESKKQSSNMRDLEVSEDRPQSSVETAGDEKVATKKVKKSSRKDKDAAAAVVAAVVEGDEAHHVASGSNGDCNSEKQIPDTNKKGKKRKQSSD